MDKPRILKLLSNGYQVPYPSEIAFGDCLLLKDYRLNCFPINSRGEFDVEIDYYEWLQEYLYNCEISLTEEQIKIRDFLLDKPDFSIEYLGGQVGFYENVLSVRPLYLFPDDFENTLNFNNLRGMLDDDPYDYYLHCCEEDDEENPQSKIDYILEDYGYHLLRTQDESDFSEHWPGFTKTQLSIWRLIGCDDPNIECPDFGWRVYLSLILKRIPDKSDRIKQLESFFLHNEEDLHK